MSAFFIYIFNHAVRVKSFQNEKRKKKRERETGMAKKKLSSEKDKCKHILEYILMK